MTLVSLRRQSKDLLRRLDWQLCKRNLSIRAPFLHVSDEVRDAVKTGKPVVALESTIYTHGFPYPENIALSSRLEALVRATGGIPATIGVLNGVAKVGLQVKELIELLENAEKKNTLKISRRDLPYICGLGIKDRSMNGGTTVSGTMVLAHLAGIRVFATGGLGGVHQGGQMTMDISADLTELGRTPVAVISSGCKSFLDIPRTLEYLETQGVCVATFADGRTGNVELPAFWTRDSGIASPKTIEDEAEAAAMIHAQMRLSITSGLLFANPISEEYSLPRSAMDSVMLEAIRQADQRGMSGSETTPFVLAKIRELTGGNSVQANRALVEANVIRGTKVAVELAKLELYDRSNLDWKITLEARKAGALSHSMTRSSYGRRDVSTRTRQTKAGVVVAGSLAVDISCTHNPDYLTGIIADIPKPHTSNPAIISQSLGGVGQNVASAMNYLGTEVKLCSSVSDDTSGQAAIMMLADRGLRVDGIEALNNGTRTAQYIAFNDKDNELVMAMADMRILENEECDFDRTWGHHLEECKPNWLVIDANWDPSTMRSWTRAGKDIGARIAYEPVSVEKSCRIFGASRGSNRRLRKLADLAMPNNFELRAMCDHVQQDNPESSRDPWTNLLISLKFGDKFSEAQNELVSRLHETDRFIVPCSLQLLPYFPCILTKVGARGVLLTELLRKDDPRLTADWAEPYVSYGPTSQGGGLGPAVRELFERLRHQSDIDPKDMSQAAKDSEHLQEYAGVYMRLFPPAEVVPQDEIVSVNGVGDTFLGVFVAGLAKADPKPIDELVMLAQRGSVMTLRSKESVSPEISSLGPLL
ncbi:hypothetical protein MMC13_002734 [Lambiella insularis]|nr:hypothetical protein [Lambiella insularis]